MTSMHIDCCFLSRIFFGRRYDSRTIVGFGFKKTCTLIRSSTRHSHYSVTDQRCQKSTTLPSLRASLTGYPGAQPEVRLPCSMPSRAPSSTRYSHRDTTASSTRLCCTESAPCKPGDEYRCAAPLQRSTAAAPKLSSLDLPASSPCVETQGQLSLAARIVACRVRPYLGSLERAGKRPVSPLDSLSVVAQCSGPVDIAILHGELESSQASHCPRHRLWAMAGTP